MEVIAEAQVFAEKTGIGCTQMEEFIGNMFGPVLESYSHRYVYYTAISRLQMLTGHQA